jgi:hypothetical protein
VKASSTFEEGLASPGQKQVNQVFVEALSSSVKLYQSSVKLCQANKLQEIILIEKTYYRT